MSLEIRPTLFTQRYQKVHRGYPHKLKKKISLNYERDYEIASITKHLSSVIKRGCGRITSSPVCVANDPRSYSPISSSFAPYLATRSSPVHGTSSSTRTSGGRLNLGLATPYVRYSASYRQQSGKLNRRSHSLTSLILVPFLFLFSSFSSSFSLSPPFSLFPHDTCTCEKGRKRRREREGGRAMKSVPTRGRPSGRLAGLQGRQR